MLTITKPYDDDLLIYDTKTKRYLLAIAGVKNEHTITFQDDGILEKRIKLNSQLIYSYIYAFGFSGNRKVVEWLINNTEEGRSFIYDALNAQMESDLATGLNSLSFQPTVNPKTGQVMPLDSVIKGLISPMSMLVINDSVGYLGINLLYPAKYTQEIFILYRSHRND